MPVFGLSLVQARLRNLKRASFAALADELESQGEIVLARSRDLAPQLTGQMIANSEVVVRRSDAAGLCNVSIRYNEPYALFQHEGYYNPGPVTSAKLGSSFAIGRKFLQRAVDERQPELIKATARKLERAIRFTLR